MVQVLSVSLAIQASYSGQKRSVRLLIEHLIFKGINAVRDDEFLETILSFVYSRRYWSIKHSNDSPSGLWPHSEQWYSIVSTINWWSEYAVLSNELKTDKERLSGPYLTRQWIKKSPPSLTHSLLCRRSRTKKNRASNWSHNDFIELKQAKITVLWKLF